MTVVSVTVDLGGSSELFAASVWNGVVRVEASKSAFALLRRARDDASNAPTRDLAGVPPTLRGQPLAENANLPAGALELVYADDRRWRFLIDQSGIKPDKAKR